MANAFVHVELSTNDVGKAWERRRMKQLVALVVTFAFTFALDVVPSIAQTQPYGSYQSSCKDVRVSGGVLHARCQGRGWNPTSIEIAKCAGRDIENIRGELQCGRPIGNVPYGSYLGSCRQVEVHPPDLMAYCRKSTKEEVFARLRLPCHGDIANERGKLVCKR